jgi:hypothetical protein
MKTNELGRVECRRICTLGARTIGNHQKHAVGLENAVHLVEHGRGVERGVSAARNGVERAWRRICANALELDSKNQDRARYWSEKRVRERTLN